VYSHTSIPYRRQQVYSGIQLFSAARLIYIPSAAALLFFTATRGFGDFGFLGGVWWR
jgi:hypothetical protein